MCAVWEIKRETSRDTMYLHFIQDKKRDEEYAEFRKNSDVRGPSRPVRWNKEKICDDVDNHKCGINGKKIPAFFVCDKCPHGKT